MARNLKDTSVQSRRHERAKLFALADELVTKAAPAHQRLLNCVPAQAGDDGCHGSTGSGSVMACVDVQGEGIRTFEMNICDKLA